MNILITNDDGIRARGLAELVRALGQEAGADIYVCAPDGQRSATGHGITMNKPITVSEVELEGVERAYQTSGLPADCVKVAMEFLSRSGIHIDMVFSGINHGGNLGSDTLYSGTVSAALEGSLCGVPSVAVSVDSHQAKHFEYACELAVNAARSLAAQIEAGRADHRTVLNINTPNRPKDQIPGLKYTSLGDRKYDEVFLSAEEEEGITEEERARRIAARIAGEQDWVNAVTGQGAEDEPPAGGSQPEQGHAEPAGQAPDPGEGPAPDAGPAAGKAPAPQVALKTPPIPGSFYYSGTPVIYEGLPDTIDVIAHQEGYATITPIHTDLTHYEKLAEIQSWGLG